MHMSSTLRTVLWFMAFFAVLFGAIAFLQFWSIRAQIYSQAKTNLLQSAADVDSLIDYKGNWDLDGYNNGYVESLNYYILTSDGLIIDIEGFTPSLIGRTIWPYSDITERPFTISTSFGDTLRVLRHKIEGGIVTLGVVGPDNYYSADNLLRKTLKLFGSRIQEASNVRSRNVAESVEYAVTNDSGRITNAYGEIPLKLATPLTIPNKATVKSISINGSHFLIAYSPIKNSAGIPVGATVEYDNITRSAGILNSQAHFNMLVTGSSFLATILLLTTFVAAAARKRSREKLSLEEALLRGEGQNIEFKRAIVEEALVREIAAFSNTNSGNLFIGVDDNGEVVGLKERTTKEKDLLCQKIRNLTVQNIKPAVLPEVEFVEHEDKLVLQLFIPRGIELLYYVNNVVYIRHIDSALKAKPEDVDFIVKKFYKRR